VIVAPIDPCERQHHDFRPLDPVEAIRLRMEQAGMKRRDGEPLIGSSSRVFGVPDCKRGIRLRMIKRLPEGPRIPSETLLAGVR
jgi:HTH-type transcriptional regulator/antitoxin HigA